MNILYYDDTIPLEEITQIAEYLKNIEEPKWLILPKNTEVLQDCSIDQLKSVQWIIQEAIDKRAGIYYSHPVQLKFWNPVDKEYQYGIGLHDTIVRASDGTWFDTKYLEFFNECNAEPKDVDDLYIEYDWRDLTKFQINSGIDEI